MASSNTKPQQPDKFFVINEENIIGEDTVRSYYELLDIKCPKNLLGREIQLYGTLMKDFHTLVDANKVLKANNQTLIDLTKAESANVIKGRRVKLVVQTLVIILSVTFFSSFLSYVRDKDYRQLLAENERLQQSTLIEQNADLRNEITRIRKEKTCWLF